MDLLPHVPVFACSRDFMAGTVGLQSSGKALLRLLQRFRAGQSLIPKWELQSGASGHHQALKIKESSL